MTRREERVSELEEGGIYCSPEKVTQANIAGGCMLAAFAIVVLGAIFGEKTPTQKPAQSAAIQVATTR
jgi:hypothetical protein